MPREVDEIDYSHLTVEHGLGLAARHDRSFPRRKSVHLLPRIDSAKEWTDLRELISGVRSEIAHRGTILFDLCTASSALVALGCDFAIWTFFESNEELEELDKLRNPFRRQICGNQPLGPLESVQVYATNPVGEYVGKAHGLCRHQKFINECHELFTLKDFIPLYRADPGFTYPEGSGWCGHCGGFAIQRLDEEQASYYASCVRRARTQTRPSA